MSVLVIFEWNGKTVHVQSMSFAFGFVRVTSKLVSTFKRNDNRVIIGIS
jgi:hypothetical protein